MALVSRIGRSLTPVALVLLAACGGRAPASDAAPQDTAAVGQDSGRDTAPQDAARDTSPPRLMDGPLATDAPACIPVTTPAPSIHNGGQDCLSCHPGFGAAGTIFEDPAGHATVGAATIRVLDADGVTHDGVTCSCGNFVIREAVAFPATVFVSRCPDTAVMVGEITYGGCNSCHAAGDRVHLP